MSETLHAHYFAVRRTNTDTGIITWLYAYVDHETLRDKFYSCPEYMRPSWFVGKAPTWFKTLGDAKRRLQCRFIKLDKDKSHLRWDVVEVQLVAHTTVAHTTETDVVAKLAIIMEEAA